MEHHKERFLELRRQEEAQRRQQAWAYAHEHPQHHFMFDYSSADSSGEDDRWYCCCLRIDCCAAGNLACFANIFWICCPCCCLFKLLCGQVHCRPCGDYSCADPRLPCC